MSFVVTDGAVRALDRPAQAPTTTLRLTDDFTQDYAEIWRTQPAVRTVVSFLARNIASLGLHSFRRISDTDRERLTDHPLPLLLNTPNPRTTRYRLFNALVHDLGIYDAAYWLKLKGPSLVRLPPSMTRPVGDTWLWPEGFEFKGGRGKRTFGPDEVVHFHGHNPVDSRNGAPPIESLRRVLAEEYEAGRMREQTLRNGARVSGYLERPADAPKWGKEARDRFKADWHGQYVGNGPQTGGTPILEDGMTFNKASQTAEQLQYVQARKLTREEVAAAYFIPPPMVGILDQATFSNITEQHKMLYQDTLGPWLTMITEELGLQLLPDFNERDIYVEFNLAEKLRGSFEEQAQAASTATGRPWMTANEQRARFNLPAVDGGDELVVPLNVLVGGQASPRDSTPEPGAAALTQPPSSKHFTAGLAKGRAPSTYEDKHKQVVTAFFDRQARAVKSKLGVKAADEWWEADRWDRELKQDLYRLLVGTSTAVAHAVLASFGTAPDDYNVEQTQRYLDAVAGGTAANINATTKQQLEDALASDDPGGAVDNVFSIAATSRAAQIATTTVTAVSGFASAEAAKQTSGNKATKTWVTGPNPRPSHSAMNGQTVGIDDTFSNGARWPADSVLGVDEIAGCNCALDIAVG